MLKVLKSSVRDTVIYSIGTFSSKLAGLILVPIYTNKEYLSVKSYGILNLIEANIQVGVFIFSLGLNYAYERWYWDKSYLEKRKALFFTILVFTTLVALALTFTSFFASTQIARLFFHESSYVYVVQLMLINTGLEVIAQTPNSLMRLNEKPFLYTTANLVKLVVSLIFTVLCLVYLKTGLKGVYYGQLAGLLAYFLTILPFILKNIAFSLEWKTIGEMIRFRFPLLFPILALNVLNFSDRFIISSLSGLSDTGVYALGAKIANTIKVFLITAIWLAITPTIYKMMDQPGNKRFYSKLMTYLAFVIIFFVIAFSLFGRELVILISDETVYYASISVIPLTALAIFFGLLKDVSLIGLNITKRSGVVGITTVIMMGINIGINFLLIPLVGMVGAAVANLITQILFFVVIYIFAQRFYPIPYELAKIFKMVALAVVFIFLPRFLPVIPLWQTIVIKVVLLTSFPFLLAFLGFYEPIEIDNLKGLLKKWKDPRNWKKNISTLQF